MARLALDEAIAGDGDLKKIKKAEKEMAEALDDLAKGKYDKVIEHYKKAWKESRKALD